MSNNMDKYKLIAEVRKRPALWDIKSEEHRSVNILQTAWKDVAAAMGSNVNECSRKWKGLRSTNREVVNKIELRIQEAKQKGSYNPNNDYGSEWTYLEHMKFMNEIKKPTVNDHKSDLEMSNAIDKFKLIAEIQKRPALWDIKSEEHRSQKIRQKVWKDVAVAMGSNVYECSRIWKHLRDMSRTILKKRELRIKEAKLNGSYNPNMAYITQWPYLEHMEFFHGIKLGNPSANENKSDDSDSNQVSKVHNMDNTKMEPERDLEMSNAMDIFKLIAEVRKRPALWDIKSEEHKSKIIHQKVWKDLAVAMGSDGLSVCRCKWRSLRCRNLAIVNKTELRIQEAKQKGSYNPNNDYGSGWIYLEHMKFMNDIKKPSVSDHKSDLEMSNRFKLIAEIRKRPALWDIKSKEHGSQRIRQKAWKDLSVAMGSDVNDCRRIWKNLRTTNQVIAKGITLRIQEAKLKGSYNPIKKKYSSNWPYFEAMEFIKNNTKDSIKLCSSDDKLQLIAEVRNRPELWDFKSKEHRSCLSAAEVWKDLAVSLGSDVETCQRNWITLCKSYKRLVRSLESRIKEAKLNGSYSPNKKYRSQWPYFEHMEFMKDNTTGSIKLRNSGDKFKLIAEVRNRPELWCNKRNEYRPRLVLKKSWEDLARAMGSDVDDCKRKWTSLLLGYRVEVKKLELRIKEDKLKGLYNPKKEYRSNWIFYERMKFCDYIKNPCLMELGNTSVNDNNSDDNDSNQVSEFQNMDNYKMEPELDLEPEVYLPDDEHNSPQTSVGVKSNFSVINLAENPDKPTLNWKCTKRSYDQANYLEDLEKEEHNLIKSTKVELGIDLDTEVYIPDDEDYDTDSQMSGMEFLSEPNSPQNQESADDKPSSTGGNCTKRSYERANLLEDIVKEEHNLTKSVKVEPGLDLDPEMYIPDDEDYDTDSQMSGMEFLSEPNSPQNPEPADDTPSSTGGNCSKRSYDQANLLEDIEKKDSNLIKSVRSNDMVPVIDSDYNFLVSFLPKMKKINELQNLQFRAKIIDLIMDIAKE
ncbi:uncharacterized protein LOC135955405 [Calliphora vicina]|uniref:uncharacterized protein LOC135955405 n=1 Tax=Calliphora vicina TaxID=7373 RepID=UPI00325A7ADC